MRSIREAAENILGGESSAHAFIVEGRSRKARRDFIDGLISEIGCHALDVVHMQMSGKSSYRVEDASAFAERLEMGAYGAVLAGVIDDADALTETVQNKLLKTLEEPRGPVIILIGSSNRDSLLDTVRSRCSVIRLREFTADADDDDDTGAEGLIGTAGMIAGGSRFYAFRSAAEKNIKSKSDAIALIDILEDSLRERLISGNGADAAALCLETAERARMDIERDMDKNRALKRLFLELKSFR